MLREMTAIGVLVGLAMAAVADETSLRVATIYSSWNKGDYSFKYEWDGILKERGVSADRYENTQIQELAGKLGDYDLVIGCSVLNFENTQDFAVVKAPFIQFLERGGIFLLTDASYGSSIHDVIEKWSPEFALGWEKASAHTQPAEKTRQVSLGSSPGLAQVPYDLVPLAAKTGHWAHMVCKSASWRQALVDSDGSPVLVWQPVGKGILAATSYFGFKRHAAAALGEALLDNLLALAEATRIGAQIEELNWGQACPGQNSACLRLKNAGATPHDMALRFEASQDGKTLVEKRFSLALPVGAAETVEWSYVLPCRGQIVLRLEASGHTENGEPFLLTKTIDIPDLLVLFAWRQHVYRGDTDARLHVDLLPEEPFEENRHRLDVQANIGGIEGRTVTLPARSADVTVPLDGLPIGKGALVATLWRDQRKVGSSELPFTIAPDPYVRIMPDRSCQVAGKPFFPLGMYIVSWQLKGTEPILQQMREIAAGGFNLVHVGVRSEEEFRAVLAEAGKLGIMIIPEGGLPVKNPGLFKDDPAILAWNPGDEPDGQGHDPKHMVSIVHGIKDQDTSRPTYMTLCVPGTYDRYWQAADILAPDPYPIPRSPIVRVADSVERLQDAMGHSKPIWAIPQAFGGYGGWTRPPTPDEERNMTYQCLVHGARGLVYYTYWDGRFRMADHPELWAMMKRLTGEIKQLIPVLLAPGDGELQKLGPDGAVHVLLKSGPDRHLMIAVNTSPERIDRVAVPLPPTYSGTLRELFGGTGIRVQDQETVFSLPPLGVQVYCCP